MTFLSCHPGHVNPENPSGYAVEWEAGRRAMYDEFILLISYRRAGTRLERAPL
jgi:hypothetical protein